MRVFRVVKGAVKKIVPRRKRSIEHEDVVHVILDAYDRAQKLSERHRQHRLFLVFEAIENLFSVAERQLKDKVSSGKYNEVFLSLDKLESIISEFMPNMVTKILSLQKKIFTQAAEEAMMYAKDGYWHEANKRLSVLSYVKEDMPGEYQGEALNLIKLLERAVAQAVEESRHKRQIELNPPPIKHNVNGETHVEHIVVQKHNGNDYITKTHKSNDFEDAINTVTKRLKDVGFNVGASNIMVDKINDEYIATIVVRAGH